MVTPAMIPGVVDGTLTSSRDGEGNVSFQVLIREIGRPEESCDYVELVLSPEHARALGRALLADGRDGVLPGQDETSPVPCSVGVRLL